MKTIRYFNLIILFILFACANNSIEKFDNQSLTDNKFRSTDLQKIVTLQNERNTASLIEYFSNSDPIIRETAVLAIASIQDEKALTGLFEVLKNDDSKRIRMAAAFSIGQIGNASAVHFLIKRIKEEDTDIVKAKILESLGKCGNDSTLSFLVEFSNNQTENIVLNGALLGIARFSLRNIFSEVAIRHIISILSNKDYSDETKYYASISLARLKEFDLTPYFKELEEAFSNTSGLFVKMNLVSAFLNINNAESANFLAGVLQSNCDYRIKVNAIKSLYHFEYKLVKDMIFNSLNDSSVNISIQASEYLLAKGQNNDSHKYLNSAKSVKNWRVKANLMAAALKYSENKSKISGYIKSAYFTATNIYEKGALLKSLGGETLNYQFVNTEITKTNYYIIRNSGLEALVEMRRNQDFDILNSKWTVLGKPDFSKEFADIFKKAILSGDIALVAIAAEVIRDPELDFRKKYTNSYFLVQALNNCRLPQEIETYRELQKTIAFINGTKEQESIQLKPIKPDWVYISQISFNQQIEINTSKGKILAELHVNESPISVSNFMKLISQNYFNNKTFHRTVPNFVVQDGCPRGDGWGGPDYVISSEFAMNYYTEGSLGMASAGKDTESSQWFITHSPTPHLDGRYSNFGTVIKGLEVVHQLEVGDTIKSIEIINN